MAAAGMFMWHRYSPWLDITALCSRDEPTEFWLTVGRTVRYVQEQEKCGFLSKVTTVLPLSGLVGDHTGPVQGQRNHPLTRNRDQEARNGKTPA